MLFLASGGLGCPNFLSPPSLLQFWGVIHAVLHGFPFMRLQVLRSKRLILVLCRKGLENKSEVKLLPYPEALCERSRSLRAIGDEPLAQGKKNSPEMNCKVSFCPTFCAKHSGLFLDIVFSFLLVEHSSVFSGIKSILVSLSQCFSQSLVKCSPF